MGISITPGRVAAAIAGTGIVAGTAVLAHSLVTDDNDGDGGAAPATSRQPESPFPPTGTTTSSVPAGTADAGSGADQVTQPTLAQRIQSVPASGGPSASTPRMAAAAAAAPAAAMPVVAAAAPTAPTITTTPGSHLLALTKTGPRSANAATDPQAFRELLAASGPGWAAADGTISIPLADGKSLWLFGDTLMNLPNPDGSIRRNADFVRNSAVLVDGNKATTLTRGNAKDATDFLMPRDPNEWYWPGHGIVEGDELVVFMGRVGKTQSETTGWNFSGRGSDMVRLDLSDLSIKKRVPMPGGHGWDWGTAVVDDGNHTYVYGFRGYDDDPFRREAVVARTASGKLKEGGFEYWDGKRWTGDASKAAPVADGLSNSFSVIRTPNGRYAMTSQELFFGTKLFARTSDTPQGPWSDWKVIDEGPTKGEGQISYNAQVHPAFNKDGKILASWNMNLQSAVLPGPDQLDGYRPVFRAIDIDAIEG